MSLFEAALEGDVELARKCISDGANVNNNEVSYDVHVYHIEGSIGRMHYYDLNNLNFWSR